MLLSVHKSTALSTSHSIAPCCLSDLEASPPNFHFNLSLLPAHCFLPSAFYPSNMTLASEKVYSYLLLIHTFSAGASTQALQLTGPFCKPPNHIKIAEKCSSRKQTKIPNSMVLSSRPVHRGPDDDQRQHTDEDLELRAGAGQCSSLGGHQPSCPPLPGWLQPGKAGAALLPTVGKVICSWCVNLILQPLFF